MATAKTWTADDVKMNVLRLSLDDSNNLSVIHGYSFVDSEGDEIEELPKRTIQFQIAWSSVPTNIQESLVAINNYTYARALAQEGMD